MKNQRAQKNFLAFLIALYATLFSALVAASPVRRRRIERTARVWRLTLRRAFHFGHFKFRSRRSDEKRKAELEEEFVIRSAEDVAEVLGNMKGVIMKAGQMVSFLADGLPEQARLALTTLQADVPPMEQGLAERVVKSELGQDVEHLFLDWDPIPIAAASIGQVHRAVMPDGRYVAVKVQYPGVDFAVKSDLDNAELLYGVFRQFALKNLDVRSMVDELRLRMAEELDYRYEAHNQSEIARLFQGHPFIHIPEVIPERSSQRVLTSEWVDGLRFDDFVSSSTYEQRQRVAEILVRFGHSCVYRYRVFNGDPHPGNYRFHKDGTVTFLDFGLTKQWTDTEFNTMMPLLDAVIAEDPQALYDALVGATFLPRTPKFDPEYVFEYVKGPWEPYMTDRFSYSPSWVSNALQRLMDVQGVFSPLIRAMNMPASYVVLDRVMWGVTGMLGRLEATNYWKAILAEYREDALPSTDLGSEEREWLNTIRHE